jgi:excisionase family DNA binding protein
MSNDDSLAADILRGADAIAAFLGFPRRTVYHLVAKHHIPYFRLGETLCARRSTLTAWITHQEQARAAA